MHVVMCIYICICIANMRMYVRTYIHTYVSSYGHVCICWLPELQKALAHPKFIQPFVVRIAQQALTASLELGSPAKARHGPVAIAERTAIHVHVKAYVCVYNMCVCTYSSILKVACSHELLQST